MSFIKKIINNGNVELYKYDGEDLKEHSSSSNQDLSPTSELMHICFLDTETTGTNLQQDKIVEEEILNRNIKLRAIDLLNGQGINKQFKELKPGTTLNRNDLENLNLIGWQTEDIYQNLTVTYIYDVEINKKIDNKIFNLPKL